MTKPKEEGWEAEFDRKSRGNLWDGYENSFRITAVKKFISQELRTQREEIVRVVEGFKDFTKPEYVATDTDYRDETVDDILQAIKEIE